MTEFWPMLAWQLENINVARIKTSTLVLEHRRSTIPWQEEAWTSYISPRPVHDHPAFSRVAAYTKRLATTCGFHPSTEFLCSPRRGR